ncbi:MAG: T9SS type A sorting domain-containing protein [Prolixibacteraceae bacterium]|nr:T9SS type A sorting domain-containing protein [Prolixibacteraceae bacterium]
MIRKTFIVFFLFLGMMLPGLDGQLAAQDVEIDFSQHQQIIRGFGGIHINSWTGQQLNADMQEKAFDNDPGEMGLSIFRLRIDPSSNNWTSELPIAQYARSKGALVFASPWNPPSHMRAVLESTNEYTDYVLLPEYYDDYAAHLNSYIDFMEANGVPLYAVSIQNEPDWHDWTRWTPAQMITFLKNNAPDIKGRVIAPESLGYVRNTIDPLLKDSAANAQIDILGTHLYGTPKANFYYPLAYEKQKEIWMTEHLTGSNSPDDNTWELALELADEINTCMDAGMSAYVYWYIRRFYGLMNESGNITDKGYVLSQFSKFIRPGAYRVAGNFKPTSGVSATAFQNDSSVVLVLVNNNKVPVTLYFSLQNLSVQAEKMTRFTTSASKKMVNDGSLDLNNGTFTVSIDAMSITTFTTDPSQGGRYGNQAPTASAGGDRQIEETSGSAVQLTLDGQESTDPDGEIVKYSWAENGLQISTLPALALELTTGTYAYVLTVTDNDGATDSDTINITIYNDNSAELWLEAECTTVGSNWDNPDDETASNGQFLTVKTGIQSTAGPSADEADHLVYHFHVNESGNFKVWGRVKAPSYDDDSFWIKVNNGEWTNWNGLAVKTNWEWMAVFNGSAENHVIYPLDTGWHTLSLCFREDGAAIDKFYLTNTGNQPDGLGADASNCAEEPNRVDQLDNNAEVLIYPNPVKTGFRLESSFAFSTIRVFDQSGRKVLERSYPETSTADDLQFNEKQGIYLIQLLGNKQMAVKKFRVE